MGVEIQKVLVDRATKIGGFESYAALARRMGVTTATLSQWRTGTVKLPERRLAQLCEFSGDDPGVFQLALMAETTNVVSLRKSIQQILKQIAPTMSLVLIALSLSIEADAANFVTGHDKGRIYIMRTSRQASRILTARGLRWLATLFTGGPRDAHLLAV